MTSTVKQPSAVTQIRPPRVLIRLGNPMVRLLLCSPLHGLADSSVLLLCVTGSKTGRHYSIPVNYVNIDGRLTVVTAAAWRVNLRGGADVDVTLLGRPRPMRALLEEDPSSVAVAYQEIINYLGWHKASGRLGISGPEASSRRCSNSRTRPGSTAGRS
jgi:hypothetical protein